MPFMRDPNADAGTSGYQLPITRGVAVTVLAALLGLIILRQLFGSIRVEAGTR